MNELRILVDQEMPHVTGINETKTDSSTSDTDIQIEGYRVVRRDRNNWGVGVALFIHGSISDYCIPSDLMDNNCNLESLSIQSKLGNFKSIIITSVYLPDVSVDVFWEVESLVRLLDKENKGSIRGTLTDLLTPTYNRTKHLKI